MLPRGARGGPRSTYTGILVWTLCNEMYMGATFKKNGVTFGAERFHAVKQTLDPVRLMNDQDGACGAGDVRDSLSFCSLGRPVLSYRNYPVQCRGPWCVC